MYHPLFPVAAVGFRRRRLTRTRKGNNREDKLRYFNKRGQAIAELAIFGSIILVVLGSLIAYFQRENDQQYIQMEAFRRALERACTYQGETSGGAGASVQLSLMQDRHHIDISGNFMKGDSTSVGSSSSVFWAIPKVGEEPESLIVYKINEDERQINYRDLIPEEEDEEWVLHTEDTISDSSLNFRETNIKQEDTQGITNTRTSILQENKHVSIPYKINEKDGDYDDENNVPVSEGTLWELTQYLYQDSSGQYKYSRDVLPADTTVERGRTWRTDF